MRISGWHIDGFGMFADYRLDDLPEGLTVLYGPNEAGKTTLVNFILSVLFGFSDGRSKGPRYEPLAGGNHGGRLFLRDETGVYTVERTKAGKVPTVRSPGGQVGGEEALRDLLGGADRTLFHNVFAFGLKELEDLKALEGDSVRERIFATPTFGGGPSAREIVKKLTTRERELFRPRADSTIGDLRRRLEEAHRELVALQREAKSYERAVRDVDEAGRVVAELAAELRERRQEAARYETLIDVWPQWSERLSAEQEAGSIEVPDGVEPALEIRFREVEQQIKEAEAVLRERRKDLERQQSRLEKIVVDDALPPVATRVKSLHAEIQRYDADRTRLGSLRSRIENLQTDVSASLAELGPQWTRARVEGFDTSIPVKGMLVEWRDRLSAAGTALDDARRRVADLEGRLEEVSAEGSGHRRKLEQYGEVPSVEELDASEAMTRRLRILVDEVGRLRERVRADEDRAAEMAAIAAQAGRRRDAAGPPGALFAVPAILAVAGVATGLVGEIVSAVLFFVLAVASGVGVVVWRRSTAAGRDARGGPQGPGADAAEETRRRLGQTEGDARALAAELGFSDIPEPVEIEDRLAAIARRRSEREAADVVAELLAEALEKERRLGDDLEQAKAEFEQRRSRRVQLEGEWDVWRAEHGIAEPLQPEVVMDLVPAIARTRDLMRQEHEARAEAGEVRQRIERFEREAAEVLAAVGREADVVDSALMAAVETLYRDVLADESDRASITGLTKGIAGARRDLEEAEADLERAEAARDRLLAGAGVADGAALGEALERLRRRTELDHDVTRLSRIIESRIGGGESGDRMREELSTGDLPRWRAELDGLTTLIGQLERDHEEAVRRHQDLRTAAERIASSSDVAEKALAVEACREELAEATAEWARVATARTLIEATLDRFERKHQPKVVERAAELFGHVTLGRYPGLLSSEGSLVVLSRGGDQVDVVDLSTGTVQQLYLCLRFALAEEFAGRGARLPLIMDDVLVNFDPERAGNVADVISEVAAERQVLLLTCHPATRELMVDACPDARVVQLERFPR